VDQLPGATGCSGGRPAGWLRGQFDRTQKTAAPSYHTIPTGVVSDYRGCEVGKSLSNISRVRKALYLMAETGIHCDYLTGIQNDKKLLPLSQLAD
jgi:hypothetical protein